MRLFALIGALLVAGGVFLLVDGGLRLQRLVGSEVFSLRIWNTDFWLLSTGDPRAGLGTNAHWFLRLGGGLLGTLLGMKLLRAATR